MFEVCEWIAAFLIGQVSEAYNNTDFTSEFSILSLSLIEIGGGP